MVDYNQARCSLSNSKDDFMDYFEDGDIPDLNYQRAMVELRKFDTPEYLINFWCAVGIWRSGDTPKTEISHPWNKGIEHLTTR